jgi:undecaprenyl-diphosphatase
LGLRPSSPEFVFLLVMLHTGTMFAVIYYFWPRWRGLLLSSPSPGGLRSPAGSRWQFLLMVFLATVCTGVLGLGLKAFIEKVVLPPFLGHEKGQIEDLFESLYLIAASLFAVGVFIVLAGSRETASASNTVTFWSAVWIGLVQGLCLPFRGFSRSGATISTALFCGMSRSLAEDFSFALAVVLTPPVIARSLYKLLGKNWTENTHLLDLLLPGLVGMVFSFVSGFLALKVLSAALEKGRWKYFGYYCIAASVVVLAAAIAGV